METTMTQADDAALDVIFCNARTYTAWQDKPVSDETLMQVYDLCKWGPTSSNCLPMRIIFVKSTAAKERLKSCLAGGNVEKTMKAPATAIIAYDMEFYNLMPKLWPHSDMKSYFAKTPDAVQPTAFRNGSLQGAYFIIAARALGLDCGPMSGFDNAKVDGEFFKDTQVKSNFLCNLGYGDASKLYPRGPRLAFEEACKII